MIRDLYNRFARPLLPLKYANRSGVAVKKDVKLLDFTDSDSTYERPLLNGIESCVQREDDIVIIGGGQGVSAVWSAISTGPHGSVSVYEAAKDSYRVVQRTVSDAGLSERVNVHHNVVGKPGNQMDTGQVGDIIEVSRIAECDVLVVDCEGAEVKVMSDIESSPRCVVLEFHEEFGATKHWAFEWLESNGYETVWMGWDFEPLGAGVVIGKNSET